MQNDVFAFVTGKTGVAGGLQKHDTIKTRRLCALRALSSRIHSSLTASFSLLQTLSLSLCLFCIIQPAPSESVPNTRVTSSLPSFPAR